MILLKTVISAICHSPVINWPSAIRIQIHSELYIHIRIHKKCLGPYYYIKDSNKFQQKVLYFTNLMVYCLFVNMFLSNGHKNVQARIRTGSVVNWPPGSDPNGGLRICGSKPGSERKFMDPEHW
jgi:hypothetical protein